MKQITPPLFYGTMFGIAPVIVGLTLISVPSLSLTTTFMGNIIAVLDGDTIEVLHNGHAERIRLNGIDLLKKTEPLREYC